MKGCWKIDRTPLEMTEKEAHLGLLRTSEGKTTETVKNNITKARRALYALTSSGMHGLNGLHPTVSMKLWNAYILPHLTYGLEQAMCSKTDIELLEKFQRATFRRIQHLPDSTANVAVLLMLGELPIQATVDKQTLVFFVNVVAQAHSNERQLVHRQLAIKTPDHTAGSYMLLSCYASMTCHLHITCWKLSQHQEDGKNRYEKLSEHTG